MEIMGSWRVKYTVKARYGDQELDVREFVLPRGDMVARILEGITAGTPGNLVWSCWDWVCREIEYPPLPLATADYHREEAFLVGESMPWVGFLPIKRSTKLEFWQFPFETIDHRMGDCEDTSILLCSLLRNRLPADQVHVAVGKFLQYGHAWISLLDSGDRCVLESTLDAAFPYQVLDAYPYRPLLYFNDEQAFEVNGGIEELKEALQDDRVKLRLIREAYHQSPQEPETKPTLKGVAIMGACIGLAGAVILIIRDMLKR